MQTKTFSVVLIDDDRSTREIFEIVLNGHGLEVITFECPLVAYEYLENQKPDVIVIDLLLHNNMSGYEAMMRIRELCPHARILATTAQRMFGTINETLERGFDGYIPKPLDTRSLVRMLLNFRD